MKLRSSFFLFLFLFLFTKLDKACAAFFEANTFYYSDSSAISSVSSTSNRTFFDVAVGFNLDKKGMWQLGWNYGSYSATSASGSTTTAYSSQQMGPKLNVYFDKDRNWGASAAYNLVTSATYTASGGTSELWKGTAFKFDFGHVWRPSESWGIGLRVNYVSATYVDRFINGTNYTAVSNTRTDLFPSLYLSFDF